MRLARDRSSAVRSRMHAVFQWRPRRHDEGKSIRAYIGSKRNINDDAADFRGLFVNIADCRINF